MLHGVEIDKIVADAAPYVDRLCAGPIQPSYRCRLQRNLN